jgi:hypothetical protein
VNESKRHCGPRTESNHDIQKGQRLERFQWDSLGERLPLLSLHKGSDITYTPHHFDFCLEGGLLAIDETPPLPSCRRAPTRSQELQYRWLYTGLLNDHPHVFAWPCVVCSTDIWTSMALTSAPPVAAIVMLGGGGCIESCRSVMFRAPGLGATAARNLMCRRCRCRRRDDNEKKGQARTMVEDVM